MCFSPGYSWHEGVHEQSTKCSSPERHEDNTSYTRGRRLYSISFNMRREKEYSRSFPELHIRSFISPSRNDVPLLQNTSSSDRVLTRQKLLLSGTLSHSKVKIIFRLIMFWSVLHWVWIGSFLLLQSSSDISDDVTPYNIISKLSLLVLHFPRLRLLWSRSLHATAEIFTTLKSNQDEPDETRAIRVGVPSEEGIIENDIR